MARDDRPYHERHAFDTYPSHEDSILRAHFPEYKGFTEAAKAIARAELELYPLTEFRRTVNEAGGLRDYIKHIIELHSTWGIDA